MQTTFDLEGLNTWEEALQEAQSWDVRAPVAQDKEGDKGPMTMQAYRSHGTPWTIVIDRENNVRYNGQTPSYAFLEALVAEIVAE